jgi:protein-disulfide isomerase
MTTSHTRRRFLVGLGTTALTAAAGCLSSPRDPGDQAAGQPLSVPTKGDPEAAVTVTTYEDIGCPHCQTYQTDVYPAVEREYVDPGRIRYEFRDLVLPADGKRSWEAASAARAVQDRAGTDAFWSYLDALFANQSSLGPDTYETVADDMDLDGAAIREAGTNQAYDETVSHYTDEAKESGIDSTPTVTVDGTTVDWGDEIAADPVLDAIEAALA